MDFCRGHPSNWVVRLSGGDRERPTCWGAHLIKLDSFNLALPVSAGKRLTSLLTEENHNQAGRNCSRPGLKHGACLDD